MLFKDFLFRGRGGGGGRGCLLSEVLNCLCNFGRGHKGEHSCDFF